MLIDHINPPLVARKQFVEKKPKPESRAKEYRLTIMKVDTKVERNRYRNPVGDREPMLFLINFTCQDRERGDARVYFKHTLPFSRCWGYNGSRDEFERVSTEFAEVTRLGPEALNSIKIRYQPGDVLTVKGSPEARVGMKGYPYTVLSRVKLVRPSFTLDA